MIVLSREQLNAIVDFVFAGAHPTIHLAVAVADASGHTLLATASKLLTQHQPGADGSR